MKVLNSAAFLVRFYFICSILGSFLCQENSHQLYRCKRENVWKLFTFSFRKLTHLFRAFPVKRILQYNHNTCSWGITLEASLPSLVFFFSWVPRFPDFPSLLFPVPSPEPQSILSDFDVKIKTHNSNIQVKCGEGTSLMFIIGGFWQKSSSLMKYATKMLQPRKLLWIINVTCSRSWITWG